MENNIIRSHRARVIYVNNMLINNPAYKQLRISPIDKEAFVEFLLLEDIVRLYEVRLKKERENANAVPNERANELKPRQNIEKISAIINIYNAAIAAAHAAIYSGDYKKVWKAIHEGALMTAAKSIKYLPELRDMGIELLRELYDGVGSDRIDTIEEVIRAVEAAIPDPKSTTKVNPNT